MHPKALILTVATSILLSTAIFLVGERSWVFGQARYENDTEIPLWVSYPLLINGPNTFEAVKVDPHHFFELAIDRPRKGDRCEILVYEQDPGPPVPNQSNPSRPINPTARVNVTGEQLLQTRELGPITFTINGARGEISIVEKR